MSTAKEQLAQWLEDLAAVLERNPHARLAGYEDGEVYLDLDEHTHLDLSGCSTHELLLAKVRSEAAELRQ